MRIPPPRRPGSTYSIMIICLGNICRSPTAEVVLTRKLELACLDDVVRVSSTGTGDWHVGQGMDARAAAALVANGYNPTAHRARTFDTQQFADFDLVLVMDRSNHRDVTELLGEHVDRSRLAMFRSFDPQADDDLDMPDPWGGGPAGFDNVLTMVERTSDALVASLRSALT
ncbi:MAG: low molecular weight protein-tyrosine-phosphatase [Nocardioidaceae bacterium]